MLTVEQITEIIDFTFAEKQGHCPADLYEDGYSDACAEIKKRIKDYVHAQ